MASVPFHYVDLRTFCYATEDEKRVEQALRTFLPDEFDVNRVANEGHHGDRIVVLSARVENADDVRHVLSVLSELPDIDRVIAELDERVDDNNSLFLRLDKQAAFGGEVRLGPGMTLRAKVEAYPAKREKAVENAREALSELAAQTGTTGRDGATVAAGDGDAADPIETTDTTGDAERPDANEAADAGDS
ncbi:RNA-binding protein [Halorarum halophilum]|uniref:RNA-binding protein n=1 Tax=Halorarum halophilum TaxID=2743090 RepID=A0A7D5GE40_9EURY|nr:RNA-binding protein [Halobaculum halophilum]QLG27128.1 RNA-binding protein [Halobaculum halophilum]